MNVASLFDRFFHGREPVYTNRMPIEPQQERLYSITETASRLGMTRQRVHKLIQEGRLKATQHGRLWLIAESEIDTLQSRIRPTGRPRKG
jgi:excisionase family DNA binding protein